MKEIIKMKGNAVKLAKQKPNSAFAHGCNCFNTMGKGMAVEVRTTYPDMYYVDCKTKKGDRNKLGTFTCAKSFKKGIESIIVFCIENKIEHLYLPYIGCGLANYNVASFEQAVSNIYTKIQREYNEDFVPQLYFVEYRK